MQFIRLLSTIVACLLMACIAWPIGGNFPHTRTVALAVVAFLCGFATVWQFFQKSEQRFPTTWLILVLGVGYSLLQLAPLNADGDSISINPAATRERICELILGIGLYFAAGSLFYRSRTIIAVFTTAIVTGVAIVIFGIGQKLNWNGLILGAYELSHGGTVFGPFVNRNNAGGFLNACFSAAVFFVAWQLLRWRQTNIQPEYFSWQGSNKRYRALRQFYGNVMAFFAYLQVRQLYAWAALSTIFAGVLVSLSRGAMAAIFASLAMAIAMVSLTYRGFIFMSFIVVTLAMAFAMWTDQSEALTKRVESVSELSQAAYPRLTHWQETWPYIADHIVWGSGQGTYRFMNLVYQKSITDVWFVHAENIFIETIAEMGMIGFLLLLAVLGACLCASYALSRCANPFDSAVGITGVTCLTGQTVASFFDFGLYQPANATVVAILMGTVVGRAAYVFRDIDNPTTSVIQTKFVNNETKISRRWQMGKVLRITILVGLLPLCAWAIHESRGVEYLRMGKRQLQRFENTSGHSVELLEKAGNNIDHALQIRPDDAEAYFQKAEYFVARYRYETAKELDGGPSDGAEPDGAEISVRPTDTKLEDGNSHETVDKDANQSGSDAFGEELSTEPANSAEQAIATAWYSTSLTVLHGKIAKMIQDDLGALSEFIDTPSVRDNLVPAWKYYQDAESLCGKLPKTQFRLAQLSILFEDGKESQRIRAALDRFPANSRLLYDCGLLALQSANHPLAIECWARCLARSQLYEENIIEYSRAELPMKTLFEEVLPQDPKELIRIAKQFFNLPEEIIPKMLLLFHARRVLDESEYPDEFRHFFNGELERLQGNPEVAAKEFKRAIELDPTKVSWRIEYAKCLRSIGDYNEAIRQLKICQMEPGTHARTINRLLVAVENQRRKSKTIR